uniref:Uncharacterized protein n=1 Tax=Amphimedon queenslandica TaxID=400682 RepID=A0A1X7UZ92_AMPQE
MERNPGNLIHECTKVFQLNLMDYLTSLLGGFDLSTPLTITAPAGASVSSTPAVGGAAGAPVWSLLDWFKIPEISSSGNKLPLAISSALPPIPARAVDKIERGVFIDFKELFHDNVALFNRN